MWNSSLVSIMIKLIRGALKGICCRFIVEESTLIIADIEESRPLNAISVTPIISTNMSFSTGVANGEHAAANLTCVDNVPLSLLILPFWRMHWMSHGILKLSWEFRQTIKQDGCAILPNSRSSQISNLTENVFQEWLITGKPNLYRGIDIAETISTFV